LHSISVSERNLAATGDPSKMHMRPSTSTKLYPETVKSEELRSTSEKDDDGETKVTTGDTK
jgi:hypothetical protein